MNDECEMMNGEPTAKRDIVERTKAFALRVIRLYAALPKHTLAQTLGKQLLRSGTSVGAQCREGRRARSNAEFITKLEIALQELDETGYWLELLVEANVLPERRLKLLQQEANELIAILVTSVRRVKTRRS